jgi:hypothetical protein
MPKHDMRFDPAIAPYMVEADIEDAPRIVPAPVMVTPVDEMVFEPAIAPYRVVPEMVEALMVFDPSICP